MTSLVKKTTNKKSKSKQTDVAESSSQKMTKTKAWLNVTPNSSDFDCDMERNFTLFTDKSPAVTREEDSLTVGEEEEDLSDGEGLESEDENGPEEDVEGGENEVENGENEDDKSDDDGDSGDVDDNEAHSDSDGHGKKETKDDIKKELSTMSFEEIMKLQNKVGKKVYNEMAYGATKGKQPTAEKKRQNKNRPMEISAKRPAPFLRQVVPVKKKVSRDPRFDDLSGEYKPEIFEKTYKFMNDIRQREKEVVQKMLKKTKPVHEKEKLQFLLKRMENQERARKSLEQQREAELEFKRRRREMAGQGLEPFFLKSSDKKKLELAEKYHELKKSGKLENFLSKKRKRNAAKDRRKLPSRHQPQ